MLSLLGMFIAGYYAGVGASLLVLGLVVAGRSRKGLTVLHVAVMFVLVSASVVAACVLL